MFDHQWFALFGKSRNCFQDPGVECLDIVSLASKKLLVTLSSRPIPVNITINGNLTNIYLFKVKITS